MRPSLRKTLPTALLTLALVSPPVAAPQAVLPTGFVDRPIASGLKFPVAMAPLPDGRVLFTEKGTQEVRLIVNSVLVAAPVGTVDNVRDTGGERGLLGIAVDPLFPARPYVYVFYDWTGAPAIRISRYTLGGDLGFAGDGTLTWDPASRYDVISDLPDNSEQHNGGAMRFGPDGKLYVAVGNDDQVCNAVFVDQLIGKILRLDVSQLPDGPGGPPDKSLITPAGNPFVNPADPPAGLVWALGLRNPFTFQIDMATGNLYIADVGDVTYEELDLANAPGMNFGYPAFEGPIPGTLCPGQPLTGLTFPIYGYDRTAFPSSVIISAGIYHRPSAGIARFSPDYEGDCFISDFEVGFLRRLKLQGGVWAVAPPVAGQPADSDWAENMDGVTDYFTAQDGSLWYCKYAEAYVAGTGEIRRILVDPMTVSADPSTATLEFAPPRPTPASGPVALAWSLPAAARVRLTLTDPAGRVVRRLVDDELEAAGPHERAWDGRDDAGRAARPGIYFAQLSAGSVRRQRCVILVR